MQGVLSYRARDLRGILNGADYTVWDPSQDRLLHRPYGGDDVRQGKADNKAALQKELGLPQIPDAPLLVVISRLSDQKGMDLLLSVMPSVIAQGGQLALLGSGQRSIEDAFAALAEARPNHVAMHIGYSEELAHRLQAGGDIVLMPSRFEPCGLTQIYAMRYGTLPVVHRTGGLADTVVDATYDALLLGTATGFLFEQPTASAFQWSIERAIGIYRHPDQWARLQATAMRQEFGWDRSAAEYLDLYRSLRPNAEPNDSSPPSRVAVLAK
jgi:starch synthase